MKPYQTSQPTPLFVFDNNELKELQKQIKEIEKDFSVQEVDLVFKEERIIYNQIKSSSDAYNFVKEIIPDGLDIQEHFLVLFLNQANKIIGYYKHTKGTINSTQVDIQMIVAVAIKTLAKGLVLSHNHPSGTASPSDADKNLTDKVKQACRYFDIRVLDHIIATKNDYYSFADNAESSLSGYSQKKEKESGDTEKELRAEILKQLKKVTRANSPNLWKRIQTAEGYRKLEEQIIQRMIRHHLVPAAIIPQMESELLMD